MSDKEEMILDTDDQAARQMTVTGWVCRNGRFYGNDERAARYAGCTHRSCTECGNPAPKSWTACVECRTKKKIARYNALLAKPWDGDGAVYSEGWDRYFFDRDELAESCQDEDVSLSDLRLVHCTPNYPRPLESDYFEDALPDDSWDIPDQLQTAIEAFNEAIKDHPPLSWSPGNVAVSEVAW